VRTVSDLLHDYQHVISELELVTGSGGVFDVEVDDGMLFSKRAVRRHAEPGEVLRLFREQIVPGVKVYER
jgi:predicted Rdx family selenoprotein